MKDKIIELRKMGFSYNKIVELLGCSKSTISYHCKKENIEEPINQIDDELIKNIRNDSENLKIKDIANKYQISESSVKRHSLPKYSKRELKKCINCEELTKNKFCTSFCSSSYKHKEAYNDYLKNNYKYCNGGYTPKNFKDFFLNDQNNKCQICNIDSKWMNRDLIFVIDHIDGDASNNKRENIRMICPNCDSQTETFKSKNKNSKRRNYWKEKIIKDILQND
jgi:predicted transcriptional regulator